MPDVLCLWKFDGASLHQTVVEANQVLYILQGARARAQAFERCGSVQNCHLVVVVLSGHEHVTFTWVGKRLLGVV